MRRGISSERVAALCVVALMIGIVVGFYFFGSVYGEARTITKNFTFTATVVETIPQTITKKISHTVTETSYRTVTATALSTITESFTETTTVFERGGEVEVLGVCFSRVMVLPLSDIGSRGRMRAST